VLYMRTQRLRLEWHDDEGNHYMIAMEGFVTRKMALKILDLIELLGGIYTEESRFY